MVDQTSNPKTPRDYLRLLFTGFAMGSADIVPGVSGGTMAFILGVYESLLNAIKSFNLDVARKVLSFKIGEALELIPWRFLLALGTGMLTALLLLANVLGELLEEHPDYLFGFFFGLVVASIIAIGVKIETWTPTTIVPLIVGTVVAFLIVYQTDTSEAEGTPVVLFFSGMIAITAMILPGISGSFMLLIMGQYENVLNAIRNFEIVNIIAIAAGCALGIMIFSRILSWLLKHYYQPMIALLVGFMIGSLYKIWPWKENNDADAASVLPTDVPVNEIVFVLVLMLIGFFLVNFLDHLQSRRNPVMLMFGRLPGIRRAA
jgi:putative membrane protein